MENSLRADPLALIAVLLIAAPALAQPPLAEVARKEAARRASIGEKSRFYTNDDLAGGSRLTTGAASRPDPEAPVAGPDAPRPRRAARRTVRLVLSGTKPTGAAGSRRRATPNSGPIWSPLRSRTASTGCCPS